MRSSARFLAALAICCCAAAASAETKRKGVSYKVNCSPDEMTVDVIRTPDVTTVYLQHLKVFPEESCKPKLDGDRATFTLDLKDVYRCMVTRVRNKATGREVFYHRVVLEHEVGSPNYPKSVFLVKCDSAATNSSSYNSEVEQIPLGRKKRAPQFENFREDEIVEITGEVTGRAPVPELIVGVTQNNLLIDDELTVKPGTPLEMSIELDRRSSDIYGVMVSNMEVSDTREQEEILILNGCTVDPYLFQNFETSDGDRLRAEFKAFKFPESNFVLFKGTVNVCLDRCGGVECANGQLGYGRRKRRDVTSAGDPNKVYEVSMATIVKVAVEPVDEKPQVWVEKATLREIHHPEEASIAALSDEFGAYKYVDFQGEEDGDSGNAAAASPRSSLLALLSATALALLVLQ